MPTRIRSNSFILAVAMLAAASIAYAAPADIQFPIKELGNCTDQSSCKAYCNEESHESACEAFAKAHGLSDTDGRVKAALADGGPGGCAKDASEPEAACRSYCDSADHIASCVEYGRAHGILSGDELTQAEKVLAALKAGATLPGGCKDKSSCQATCENPKDLVTAKSCFEFAQKAGLLPPGVDPSKIEQAFSAIDTGSTTFRSFRDFAACNHPASPDILKKCVSFGEQNGFISHDQAETISETGGSGPGGCQGQQACEAFCTSHQDECYTFGKAHHMISPEQDEHLRKAGTELKDSLQNAPPGVQSCVKQAAGDAIATLGQGPIPQATGEAIRHCFDAQFNENDNDQGSDQQGPPHEGSMSSSTRSMMPQGPNPYGPPPGGQPVGGYGSSTGPVPYGNRPPQDWQGGQQGQQGAQGQTWQGQNWQGGSSTPPSGGGPNGQYGQPPGGQSGQYQQYPQQQYQPQYGQYGQPPPGGAPPPASSNTSSPPPAGSNTTPPSPSTAPSPVGAPSSSSQPPSGTSGPTSFVSWFSRETAAVWNALLP